MLVYSLPNAAQYREVVQLVTQLDGLEMDRMSGARAAAVTRHPSKHPQPSLADAFHDLSLECDSEETK